MTNETNDRRAHRVSVGMLTMMMVGLAPMAAVAQWDMGPPLPAPRSGHTATTLPSGEVLVVGGRGVRDVLILDPDAGAWRVVAALPAPSGSAQAPELFDHVALLLATGEVLVTGGTIVDPMRRTSSASFVYEPAANRWRLVGNLAAARAGASAMRLADGRVLVTGGQVEVGAASTVINGAEVYDPATGTWVLVGALLQGPRIRHSLSRLLDGRGVTFGGFDGGSNRSSALHFDPAGRQFTPFAAAFDPIAGHVAIVLPDRRVLIDGGGEAPLLLDPVTDQWTGTGMQPGVSGGAPASGLLLATGQAFEARTSWAGVLDPATTLWRDVSPTGGPLATDATLVLLRTGQVLAIGGEVSGVATAATRVWTDAPGTVATGVTGLLSSGRAGHAAVTLADGDVLVVGGTDTGLPAPNRQAAERFDELTRQWSPVPGFTHRSRPAAAALAGGKVLVVGGDADCPAGPCGALATAELYDPVTGMVRTVTPMTVPRAGATATRLGNGLVLVVGGEQPTAAETWDPALDTWTTTPPLSVRRTRHTATLLADGGVLVLGGTDGTSHHATGERFDPRARTWTRITNMPTPRVGHTATLLADGRVLVAGGNTATSPVIGTAPAATAVVWSPVTGQWSTVGPMDVSRQDHGAVLMPDGRVLVAGGDNNVSSSIELYSPLANRWQRLRTPRPRESPSVSVLTGGGVLVVGGRVPTAASLQADADVFTPAAVNPTRAPAPLYPAFWGPGGINTLLPGLRLTPVEPGDGGRRTSSPSDHPLLRLQRLDGGRVYSPHARSFSASSLRFDVPTATVGLYLATVTARGTPGSGIVRVGNTAPLAPDLALRTPEDQPLTVTLRGGDRDGDDLSYRVAFNPSRGTMSGTAPALTYTPQADVSGPDSFIYRVGDGALESTGTVRIVVEPVNDAPVALDDAYMTDEDTPLVVPAAQSVLLNDTDVDSPRTSLRARATFATMYGTFTWRPDGSFEYVPAPDTNGSDRALYVATDGALDSTPATIRITVRPVNDAPLAVDDHFDGTEDRPLEPRASLLANDSDVDADALGATLGTPPAHGQVTVRPDGTFSYVPEPNYYGPDRFTYTITDGSTTAVAAVTLQLASVNDAPVARDDVYETEAGRALTVSTATAGVLGNDSDDDGEPLTVQLTTRPVHGMLDLRPDGTFTYTPEPGYEGEEDALYVARDGQVSTAPARIVFRVGATTPVPTADRYLAREDEVLDVEGSRGVLINDQGRMMEAVLESMPEHGTVELSRDGAFRYRPAPNYFGEDHFTYRAVRGPRTSAPVEVVLTVEPVNDAPQIPRPSLPVDGAVVANGEVTFTWLPSEDPEGEAVQYRVRVERDFQVVLALTSVAPSTVVPAGSALIPGRYLWTVEALDATGESSGPSPVRTLVVDSGGGGSPDGSSPDEGGCGCTTTSPGSAGLSWSLVLALALLVRKRNSR
jgi:MYXO-CTERM domain-containing protein